MKRVLFAAGDVGGARAVLAVARAWSRRGRPLALLDHGPLSVEAPKTWERIILGALLSTGLDGDVALLRDYGAMAFASSVADSLPLALARQAQAAGLPLLHVLDNWTAYRRRLEIDGGQLLVPECYAVMDEQAVTGAVAAGIVPETLVLSGHPALAGLAAEACDGVARATFRAALGVPNKRRLLVFVSEPVAADQGDSAVFPYYRGYTESEVLELLCCTLQHYAKELFLVVLPHPREEVATVMWQWERCRGDLAGIVVRLPRSRDGILAADAVAGMSSILLYEAWCLGLPVLSLQPGLRDVELRLLERPGVVVVEGVGAASAAIATWLAAISDARLMLRPDLARHANAPDLLAEVLLELSRGVRK